MAKRSWWTGISIGCTMLGLMVLPGSHARAQDYYGPGAECDNCDSCYRLTFCDKLRLHSAYHSRRCSRPYRRLNATPPELAPYLGPGTYHSPGYGLPYGGPGGAPVGNCYGAPSGYGR